MTPPAALSEASSILCLLFILLIPLAGGGLASINTGLGRSRNAAHMMLGSLCVMGTAALVYFAVGFSWQGYSGGPAYALITGGPEGAKTWDWIGRVGLFGRGVPLDGSRTSLILLMGVMSAALMAVIPLGSGADRSRLSASCISTVILAGWTFPVFAHWAWGGGWLQSLGANYGLGRGYLDAGGAGTIQMLGGLAALAATWVLGPRRGKYTPDRMPMAIPGHNVVLVLFGCVMAWLGWIGLDSAGAILFAGAEPGQSVLIAINATLSAGGAALAAAVVTRVRFGKPDASLSANGFVGGLVATSAGCVAFRPAAAMIVGIVAGALVALSVEWLELHLTVDDPGGAVSVHAIAGLWGLLAAGWFTSIPGDPQGQWIAQIAGIAALLGFVFPMTYGLTWLQNRIRPMRVAPEGERQGLDLYELGAGAYPDFQTHNDDLLQR